jgi:hypothetical protein
MYYEDQSRRINVLSGLFAGTVLGVGLALLIQPDPPRRRVARRTAAAGLGGAARTLEAAGGAAARMAVKRFRL